jgi:hypothetical protein
MPDKITKEKIVEEIRKIAESLGHSPSRSKFISLTGISEFKVLKHFTSWNEAVKSAGHKPYLGNIKINDSDLLCDWADLVRELRQIPTRTQSQRHGKYSSGVFERHFGPWSSIPTKFRQFAKNNPDYLDVLTLLPPPEPWKKSPSLYIDDLKTNSRAQTIVEKSKKYKKLEDRYTYGDPIDFRGLRHEPVNESGVIFLFGMVARELGYMVEAVQEGFPDCEAKRQIDKGKWQRVKIEFEYASRNFRDHGHSIDGCDMIVCWIHNWDECPQNIEVLELRNIIKILSKSDE